MVCCDVVWCVVMCCDGMVHARGKNADWPELAVKVMHKAMVPVHR